MRPYNREYGEPSENSINLSIDGQAKARVMKAAQVLEVDDVTAILPLMVGIFCEMIEQYGKNEKFRDLAIIDPKNFKAVKICDLEEIRVKAKLIEYDQIDLDEE